MPADEPPEMLPFDPVPVVEPVAPIEDELPVGLDGDAAIPPVSTLPDVPSRVVDSEPVP